MSTAECIDPPRHAAPVRKSNRPEIRKLAHYKLKHKIGKGAFGTVYLAEDTLVGREVALKVLRSQYASNPEFLSRFRREAKALGRLNHPNIVAAFVVDEDEGHQYFVMEYCKGGTLGEILKRDKKIPLTKALQIVYEVALGLEYAHKAGFVHRDIKPDNIFLTVEGVKILDLGLSKNILDLNPTLHTKGKIAMGTPYYISPEQAQSLPDIDGRSDIYSLGISLFQMLAGRLPYEGANPIVILNQHVFGPPPDILACVPSLPVGVAELIDKMTAKKPEDRYRNCTELLADLKALLADQRERSATPISNKKMKLAKQARQQSNATNRTEKPCARAAMPGYMLWIASAGCLVLSSIIAWMVLK